MTDVDLCNLALGYIGDAANVTSISPPDGSAQAFHCAKYYTQAIGMVLDSVEWNFITTRTPLVAVELEYYDEWQFAYGFPSYTGKILSVIPQWTYQQCIPNWGCGNWFGDHNPYPFEQNRIRDFKVEVNQDGVSVILSNACDAICRYTTTLYDLSQFGPNLMNASARLLASLLAGPIIKGDAGAAESQKQYAFYQRDLSQARMDDANQSHQSRRPEPIWLRDR